LFADLQIIGAHIRIAVGNRVHHLRHGDAVSQQLVWIEIDMKLFRRTTKGADIEHSRNLFELPLDRPVFRNSKIHQAVSRTDELITIDLANGRPGR